MSSSKEVMNFGRRFLKIGEKLAILGSFTDEEVFALGYIRYDLVMLEDILDDAEDRIRILDTEIEEEEQRRKKAKE